MGLRLRLSLVSPMSMPQVPRGVQVFGIGRRQAGSWFTMIHLMQVLFSPVALGRVRKLLLVLILHPALERPGQLLPQMKLGQAIIFILKCGTTHSKTSMSFGKQNTLTMCWTFVLFKTSLSTTLDLLCYLMDGNPSTFLDRTRLMYSLLTHPR